MVFNRLNTGNRNKKVKRKYFVLSVGFGEISCSEIKIHNCKLSDSTELLRRQFPKDVSDKISILKG